MHSWLEEQVKRTSQCPRNGSACGSGLQQNTSSFISLHRQHSPKSPTSTPLRDSASNIFTIYTIYWFSCCSLHYNHHQKNLEKKRHVPYVTVVGSKDSYIVHALVRGHFLPPVLIYATETLLYSQAPAVWMLLCWSFGKAIRYHHSELHHAQTRLNTLHMIVQ